MTKNDHRNLFLKHFDTILGIHIGTFWKATNLKFGPILDGSVAIVAKQLLSPWTPCFERIEKYWVQMKINFVLPWKKRMWDVWRVWDMVLHARSVDQTNVQVPVQIRIESNKGQQTPLRALGQEYTFVRRFPCWAYRNRYFPKWRRIRGRPCL